MTKKDFPVPSLRSEFPFPLRLNFLDAKLREGFRNFECGNQRLDDASPPSPDKKDKKTVEP